MKQLFLILIALLAFTSCQDNLDQSEFLDAEEANNEAFIAKSLNNVSSLQIVEGQGLGDVITLGMTRTEINTLLNGGCNSGTECTFRLTPETGVITVHYNNNNRVDRITIQQSSVLDENKWPTSQGVIDGLRVTQVAPLYPGSEIVEISSIYKDVVVSQLGYTYKTFERFGDPTSQIFSSHEIYAADGSVTPPGPGETVRSFDGTIDLLNTRRRRTNYKVDLRVNTPDGQRILVPEFRVTINGNATLNLNPEQFFPLDGATGTYTYAARLKRVRGNGSVRSISRGSFNLVEE